MCFANSTHAYGMDNFPETNRYLALECADDPALVGRCLRPVLDVWEAIRETESTAQGLLFPVSSLSRNSQPMSVDGCFVKSSMSTGPVLQ